MSLVKGTRPVPVAPITKRGRPRSAFSRTAILSATMRLMQQNGYTTVTIDAIAAEAGVGRQTIYRWWRTKPEVAFEALAEHARESIVIPESADAAADLRAFLCATFERVRELAPILTSLIAEAQFDPSFRDQLRERLLDGRRRDLTRAVSRLVGTERAAIAVDAVYGAMWYRMLDGHAEIDDTCADDLVQLLAASRRPQRSRRDS